MTPNWMAKQWKSDVPIEEMYRIKVKHPKWFCLTWKCLGGLRHSDPMYCKKCRGDSCNCTCHEALSSRKGDCLNCDCNHR